ncbi:MAG TPA: hypothetical protein DDX91_05870, partial [Ruminococcaceae bacterium]|nr:hypothetical protein [Oscillospiraceae bacterium]
ECEEWNQALSCFNIIETAPAIIKRIKTKNINHSYQGLQALSAMLCGNDVEEFISNLSLYMFTDFGHVGNNVSITTADICKPNIRASFSFLSKTIGNMLLSEIHNYIRNLKSENIKNVFCSINIEENILKEEGVPIALNNPPQE